MLTTRALSTPALLALISAPAVFPQGTANEPRTFKSSDGSLEVVVHEEVIGFVDPGMNLNSMRLSPDGRRVAYMVTDGSRLSVAHDGKRDKPFDAISAETVRFSPDGSRLAYAGVREGQAYAVVDGVEYPCEALTARGITFSPDGRHFGWVSTKNKWQYVASIDGVEQKVYDGIDPRGIHFSPDGAHHAYIAGQDGRQFVVLDGAEGPPFDQVAKIAFSTDGEHLASIGVENGRLVPLWDGEALGNFGAVGNDLSFVFPNAGKGYAIACRREKTWRVIVNGESIGDEYKHVFGLTFSPDGEHVSFVAGRGEGMFLVVDGKERSDFDKVHSLTFAPDGGRYGFTATRDDRMFAVVAEAGQVAGGEEGPAFDQIAAPGVMFSPDGERTAYVAVRGSENFVVVDGEPGPAFEKLDKRGVQFAPVSNRVVYNHLSDAGETIVVDGRSDGPYEAIRQPTFSADGRRLGYAARAGNKWYAVVDGKRSQPYPFFGRPGPVFSPDGRRVAWVAGRERTNFAVVDGVEGKRFDIVMKGTLSFTPDSEHVLYVAGSLERRYLVVDDLVIDAGYEGFLQGAPFLLDDDGRPTIRATRGGALLLITLEIG